MLCAVEKSLVQDACATTLALTDLKVNVGLENMRDHNAVAHDMTWDLHLCVLIGLQLHLLPQS
jgi:hypothetical protein